MPRALTLLPLLDAAESSGMPLHPLVVHLAVVLLPVSALLVIALVGVPRWRPALARTTLVVLVVGVVSSWAAKFTGDMLAQQQGSPPITHAEWGTTLTYAASGLAVVGGTWLFLAARHGDAQEESGEADDDLRDEPDFYDDEGYPDEPYEPVSASGAAWYDRLDEEYVDDPLASDPFPEEAGVSRPRVPRSAAAQSSASRSARTRQASRAPERGRTRGARSIRHEILPAWFNPLGLAAGALALVVLGQTVVAAGTGTAAVWGDRSPGGGATAGAAVTATATPTATPTRSRTPTGGFTTSATGAPTDTDSPMPTDATDTGGGGVSTPSGPITMGDVRKHGSADSCWTVVNGAVYDLTDYVATHPGGEGPIIGLCGKDSTDTFQNAHGDEKAATAALGKRKIGKLSS